ncbi:membrane-bound lytic murein transglycosylase B [Noviherbaspirillum humi]|uniref:Membrane-bound lytic murein transglycosylase B n=1 Tax=Noviherbaspirillum humi TaxID=1688639 RepID=A0A239E0D3_9BURK|nr:lytic murein transglycosylase B [Noviherbaspirillum humi]SNS37432.1 membrane-bound lytic murein transglycosylase B [Noviherbaspirillum humi]
MIPAKLHRTALLLLPLLLSLPAGAAPKNAGLRKVAMEDPSEFANFVQWKEVSDFIDQMVSRHGFTRSELEATFGKIRYIDSAIQLMKPAPPGKPKNWRAYRARFVEPVRINAGVAFWDTHAEALARAEQTYGVPAEIIVGIIGVETVYGRNTGNFRVLDAITTLAFDYPNTPTRAARMSFFRGELENTLLLSRDTGIDPFSLLGSYAGAIGWPQFMPGSVRKFAVDFDGDGKVDLRGSPVDAIGSVANFLAEHGWKRGQPVAFPTTLNETPGSRNWEMFIAQGLEAKFTLAELRAAGVNPSMPVPEDLPYGLVDLQNGGEQTDYWLATDNFFAITQYNRSFFYAMSVLELGRAVRTARNR